MEGLGREVVVGTGTVGELVKSIRNPLTRSWGKRRGDFSGGSDLWKRSVWVLELVVTSQRTVVSVIVFVL